MDPTLVIVLVIAVVVVVAVVLNRMIEIDWKNRTVRTKATPKQSISATSGGTIEDVEQINTSGDAAEQDMNVSEGGRISRARQDTGRGEDTSGKGPG